jgi:hypothetical protein
LKAHKPTSSLLRVAQVVVLGLAVAVVLADTELPQEPLVVAHLPNQNLRWLLVLLTPLPLVVVAQQQLQAV